MNIKFQILIIILIIASLLIIFIDYMYKLDILQRTIVYIFDLIVVIILAFDFIKRLWTTNEPIHLFLLKNWYEIPAMIPLLLYSFLEIHYSMSIILRSLRFITLFRLVRLYRISSYFEKNQFLYLGLFTAITIIFGALSIYIVESVDKHSNIKNIGDGFWWAIGTVTTVAYGDVYPVTIDGKIIAGILMFASIGILGAFISTLGSNIIKSKIKINLNDNNNDDDNDDDSIAYTNSIQKHKKNISNMEKPIPFDKEIVQNIKELSEKDIYTLIKILLEASSQKSKYQNNSITCKRCGNRYPINSTYCNHCGIKV